MRPVGLMPAALGLAGACRNRRLADRVSAWAGRLWQAVEMSPDTA